MIAGKPCVSAERIPLLAEEGWREAPGWSVRLKRFAGLTTPSAPAAHPPLLCEEGNDRPALKELSRTCLLRNVPLLLALWSRAPSCFPSFPSGAELRSFSATWPHLLFMPVVSPSKPSAEVPHGSSWRSCCSALPYVLFIWRAAACMSAAASTWWFATPWGRFLRACLFRLSFSITS